MRAKSVSAVAAILAGWLLPCAAAAAGKGETMTATMKRVCERYVEGFLHPATDLVYGKRLNGPRGIAVLEPPEEIARERYQGEVKPYGYGAGIEDVAYQNGILLFALCEALEATQEPYFASLARRLFRGMRRIGTVSPVPGFVARGPHPDGKSYYRDSSVDQHSLYVCGLWRYGRSPIPSESDRAFIRDSLDNVAKRMERNRWVLRVEDGSRPAHAGGGSWLGRGPSQCVILLSVLGAVADATGSDHWRQEYRRLSGEDGGVRWRRMAQPETRLPRYTLFSNQSAFRMAVLARLEGDAARRAAVQGRLARMARDMLSCNVFTHWRRLDWIGERPEAEVNAYLRPLGYAVDSEATVLDLWRKYDPKLRSSALPSDGERRSYEALCVRAPLVAWQTALLAGEPALAAQVAPRVREVLERVDFDRVHSGWTYNYAVVLGLLGLAAEARR